MNKIDNGGPAFPNSIKITDENYAELRGMSLRDYFAAKYMAGLCSSVFYTEGNLLDGELADHAYAMADAMLKARES